MDSTLFLSDISTETARQAYYGVSQFPEGRAERTRHDYANGLVDDYATLREQAVKGGTLDLLDAEFARFREGHKRRQLAYLHSSARCVSWFIAGPANFPAARMNKRAEISHRRLTEMIDFRARALAAIRRTLRPDLRAIYAGDSDALERLDMKITQARTLQERMKITNAAIRGAAKKGAQAQIAALLELGYQEARAKDLLEPDFCGRIGFADYELTNNGANIRRMEKRLAQLTEARATPNTEIEGCNCRLEDVPADNRIRLFYPGKPDSTVRDDLKANGFRWTPSLGCWQAYRNHHSMVTARRLAGEVAEPLETAAS